MNHRWKKSIYKLVWKHMLCYFVIYIALTVIYVLLDEEKRKYDEKSYESRTYH